MPVDRFLRVGAFTSSRRISYQKSREILDIGTA